MRQFAFKNLTVNLADAQALCLQTMPTCRVVCSDIAIGQSIVCRMPSLVPTTITGCTNFSLVPTFPCRLTPSEGPCGIAHSTLPDTTFVITERIRTAVDPSDLQVLREQMAEAQSLLDVKEEELRGQLGPRTRAEAELVERRLTEALEELKQMKEGLDE